MISAIQVSYLINNNQDVNLKKTGCQWDIYVGKALWCDV